MPKINQAFILAAGFGTRMQPLTATMPKPLVTVRGKPIIDYVLDALATEKIERCVVNVHYLPERLEEHLHKRSKDLPFEILISKEQHLLDTGGGLQQGLQYLDTKKPFFAMAGDSIWENPRGGSSLGRLADAWDDKIMDILILLQSLKSMEDGSGDYRIVNDKPVRASDKTGDYMWTSVRILHPRIFMPAHPLPFSFLNLLDDAQAKGRLAAQIHEGRWHHISTPQDVARMDNEGHA